MIKPSFISTSGLPDPRARHIVPVIESQSEGSSFHRLRLACSAIARSAQPGQFVHLLSHSQVQGSSSVPSQDPLLRRAFSIMGTSLSASPCTSPALPALLDSQAAQDEAITEAWFEILFRVGGRGTSLLARSRPGDHLDVLGPLGNGFALENRLSSDADLTLGSGNSKRPLLLVGGGIGVPPLIFAAQTAHLPTVSRETTFIASPIEAFVGARTAQELVGEDALRKAGALLHISTDDGSRGHRGLVTGPLRERLRAMQQESSADEQSRPLVCACGPWPMLKAVAQLCLEAGVECLVSMEEAMPCGIGVCNGCVVPMLDAPDDYGRFQRICVHGPVLDARAVDWGDQSINPAGPGQAAEVDDTSDPKSQGASQ